MTDFPQSLIETQTLLDERERLYEFVTFLHEEAGRYNEQAKMIDELLRARGVELGADVFEQPRRNFEGKRHKILSLLTERPGQTSSDLCDADPTLYSGRDGMMKALETLLAASDVRREKIGNRVYWYAADVPAESNASWELAS